MIEILFSAIFDGLNNLFLMLGYVSNVNSFPQPLNPEEEQYYVEAYKNGSEEARNILIERNLRLVAHIVKKYGSCGNDSDDLISIGTIGLIKAISTFNMDKGTRLATYAARCIENAILTCYTQITPSLLLYEKIVIFFFRCSFDENVNLVVSIGVRYDKYFFYNLSHQF